jgi:hypothetical protein
VENVLLHYFHNNVSSFASGLSYINVRFYHNVVAIKIRKLFESDFQNLFVLLDRICVYQKS